MLFFQKKTREYAFGEVVTILDLTKKYIVDGTDFMWTPYDDAKALRTEIDRCIVLMKAQSRESASEVYSHYLPTATFQEHAMANGWHDEYIKLSSRIDEAYSKLKP
jgi:hypothetical protein